MEDFSGNVEGLGEVVTLKDALQLFDDSDKVISYLKVKKKHCNKVVKKNAEFRSLNIKDRDYYSSLNFLF